MTLAQSLTAIVIFWAIIGGLGASLLLPAMQSLIHGNFAGSRAEAGLRPDRGRGRHRRRDRSAARRVRHDLPVLAGRLRPRGRHHRRRAEPDPAGQGRRPTPAPARSTRSARSCPSSAWAAWCSASSSGRRAASSSCLLMAVGAVALFSLARWLVRRKREQRVTLLDPDLFRQPELHRRHLGPDAAAGGPRRRDDRPAALPPDDAGVQRHAGRPVAGPAVADDVRRRPCSPAGRPATAGPRRSSAPASCWPAIGIAVIIPIVPRVDSGWYLVIPLIITGCGLGLLVSQLNNYTLAPIEEERISEAAGVNSAAGLVRPVLRPRHGRRSHARRPVVQLHQPDRRTARSSRRPSSSRSRWPSRTTPRS